MTETRNPIRLLIEILVIVAVTQAVVMVLALPAIAQGLSTQAQMLLGAALLVFLSGPTVYWRCMAALRLAPATSRGKESAHTTVGTAIAMTAVAQLLGLVLTGVCVVWQQRSVSAAAQERFDRSVDRVEREVRRHFALPLYGLSGLRGLFAANGHVTRDQFRTWVESRDLAAEFPGVRGFGFIERVERDDVAGLEAEQQVAGRPEVAADVAGNETDLYWIKYIEPLSTNLAALGKEVGRETVRREAIERAASSGLPALSGRIALAQAADQGPGFMYLMPIYRAESANGQAKEHHTTPATDQLRQSLLAGLLYVPIVAAEIMKGVTDADADLVEIELFEGDAAQPGDLLFESRGAAPDGKQAPGPRNSEPAFESLRRLVIGGRTLALRTSSTPAFQASIDRSSVIVAAVGGVTASFMLALAVWLLAVGRVRAQRRAQRMTADLARLARVAQHTSNSVAITDAQMRINWVNEGFTRITGYTLEEASASGLESY